MLNIVLFGPPGSGKGTQAAKLIERYQLEHVSTGDIFRSEISNETPLGQEAKKYMDKGLLVPDEVVIGMIASKLDQSLEAGVEGFIFDGFPRTVEQAEALDKLLDLKQLSITCTIALEVSEQELIKRLLLRGETSKRSDDQDENIIRRRIREYHQKTAPVADYYQQQNRFTGIPGEGSVDEIFQSIAKEVDRVKALTE